MSQITAEPTLAVRVSQVITDESQRATNRCEREPSLSGSQATRRERDMREWGMTHGLAFGLELGANPGADWDVIAEDALDAARAAFARWSAPIAPRQPFSPAVDDVLLAYEHAHRELDRLAPDSLAVRELLEKLHNLKEIVGMPEPAVMD